MQTLNVLVWGLVALGLLVFVHELGHFLLAKAAGIRVLKFSLGFGSRVWGFHWGETEVLLSWLPLGGYVKMAGELPEPGRVPAPGDYLSRPWWVRVGVLCGGPAANLVAAVLVLGTLFWAGFSVPLAKPQVMEVEPGGPAAAAGLQAGDVITALDGLAVEDWEAFSERLNRAAEAPGAPALRLGLSRRGRGLEADVRPFRDEAKGRWRIGVTLGPAGTTSIERVYVGTPAEAAGLKVGDRVLSVEGQEIWTRWDFQSVIWRRAARPTRLSVERGGRIFDLEVTPTAQQMPGQGRVGVIGVSFKSSDAVRRVQYGFLEAYRLGAAQTWGLVKTIFISLGQMASGQVSVQDSVGGPITIMRMAGQEARSGLSDFLFFLASISVMLAVLNLLPIPVLDGGNAVLFILEGLRGRPLSVRWQDGLQRAGLALLLALMVYATYNDLYKLILPVFGGPTP
jgi:regulator of sigma E protease